MKKKLPIYLFLIVFTFNIHAQTPQGIYYQAVVRDSSGNLVQNKPVSLRFSIHNSTPSGSIIYQQTDTIAADMMGLITVVVGGGGSITQGNFGSINWALGSKFMQVEVDASGGINYTDMGTTQMLSVPYALYAASAGNNTVGPTGATGPPGQTGATGVTGVTGATGVSGVLNAGTAPGNTPYWNGTSWVVNNSNIYNDGGNVGIQTNNPQATLDVNGYTMLGADAPKIKMKKFTGTVPGLAGQSTSINLGIPDSSIILSNVIVSDPVNGLIQPLSALTGVQFTYSILNSTFTLTTNLTNSLAILNKPFKVTVIYGQ